MKAGQTVAATIRAAVISIALFRLPFFRGGVLEQNLTRTAASVGEALVAGAIFTIPAFMMVNVGGVRLWQDLRSHFWVGTLILLAGGLLGVFFIIILRRPLCVESTDLPFPESTASAEIVKAGQQGATDAPKYIFGALGLGAFLQVLKDEKGLQVFKDSVSFFVSFPKSVISYFGYQKEQIGTVTYAGGFGQRGRGPCRAHAARYRHLDQMDHRGHRGPRHPDHDHLLPLRRELVRGNPGGLGDDRDGILSGRRGRISGGSGGLFEPARLR